MHAAFVFDDINDVLSSIKTMLKVTRPSFFFVLFLAGGGYHPTLKLSGIPTFTFIVSLTHRMDNNRSIYNIT